VVVVVVVVVVVMMIAMMKTTTKAWFSCGRFLLLALFWINFLP
jgi:hypothetical protein